MIKSRREDTATKTAPGDSQERGIDKHKTRQKQEWLRSSWFLAPTFFVLVVALWESSVKLFSIPSFILPAPSEVLTALVQAVNTDAFWVDVRVTATEMGSGFVIGVAAALILGFLIAQISIVDKTLMPYIISLQAVPNTALAPLFLVWFGFGIESKITIAALSTFFPVLITVIEGLKSVDRQHIAMLRSLDASQWQVLRFAKLPSALPFIFAGVNMGVIFALIGAVVGEFVGAQAGLGYRILQANFEFDIAGMFAALIALSLMGLVPYYSLRLLRKRIIFWEDPHNGRIN